MKMLIQWCHVGKVGVLRISPVLGVHAGPGIVGSAVLPPHLVEESA